LPVDVAQCAYGNVLARMGDYNVAGFFGVLVFGMVAFATCPYPALAFQPFDEFRAVHIVLHTNTQNNAEFRHVLGN
jgi:hypothetical protein